MFDDQNLVRICKEKDCGSRFEISRKEADWLKEKGLELFKRCPACRMKRRGEKKERN
jgi:hypothetical protein